MMLKRRRVDSTLRLDKYRFNRFTTQAHPLTILFHKQERILEVQEQVVLLVAKIQLFLIEGNSQDISLGTNTEAECVKSFNQGELILIH